MKDEYFRGQSAHGSVRRRQLAIVIAMTLGVVAPAQASHFRSGTITWKPVGTPANRVIEFRVQNSWRRDGFTAGDYECVNPNTFVNQNTNMPFVACTGLGGNPGVGDVFIEFIGDTFFDFGDGTATVGSPGNPKRPLMYKVTATDPTNNWLFGEALDPFSLPTVDTTIQHTYATTGFKTAKIDSAARISPCTSPNAHMNNPDGDYRIQTVVDVGTGNSSPVSSIPPIVLCPQNGVCTFPIPVSDNEGDTITYRFATTAESGITSQPGSPQCPNTATVSPAGVVTWNTSGCRLAGNPLPQPPAGGCNNSVLNTLYSTQLIIEEPARGTKIALDFFIQLVDPCALPNAGPEFVQPPSPCGATISAGPGTPLSFTVRATDSDAGDLVTMNGISLPSGATMTPPLPTAGNPASSTFAWTPTLLQIGQNVMTFTATDRCNVQQLCAVTIDVSQENCSDGIDNDGDGQADCADQDCAGAPCTDGQFCTVNDICQSHVCTGAARDCSDGNQCTADSCNEGSDQCVQAAPPLNGTGCDDGAYCTVNDTCQSGTCSGPPRDCDDHNECTGDGCDENADQCTNDTAVRNGNTCDDGNFCSVGDTCQDGACSGGGRDCTDHNQCTVDSCNENADQCEHDEAPLNDTACDDGAYCTVDDTCENGACIGANRDCDDGNACTGDSCNENADRCDHPASANGTGCSDGLFCNGNDTCQAGVCTPGAGRDCSDTSVCTVDSCDENGDQCVHDPAPVNGTPCSDGTACTQNDRCSGGACTGTSLICSDGNACNGAESCDPSLGCRPGTPLVCSDNDVCNGIETCNPASGCVFGTPLNCNDGTDCSVDRCDPTAGCSHSRMPADGCLKPGKSLFLMRDRSDDRRDKLVWKWSKGSMTSLDLGNPNVGGTKYTLCIYDQSDSAGNATLKSSITIPPGGMCEGIACWTQIGAPPKRFKYKSKTNDSFKKLILKTSSVPSLGGLATNGKVVFKVRGSDAPLPSPGAEELLDQSTHVLVQLINSVGRCWEGEYRSPAIRNRPDIFKDKCLQNGQGVCE